MTVQLRTSGAWYNVPNGRLNIRYGGVWRSANYCYIKIGNVGGGYWYDSGYRGLPGMPGDPAVYAWDYSNIGIYWSASSGGAPVTNYIVQSLDSSNNVTGQWDVGTATSFSIGVSQSTLYQFRIYARSAGGLQTGPSGSLRVGIGHPQQDNYGYVQRSRGWSSHVTQTAFNRDNFIVVTVPSSVQINAVHWVNLRSPQSSQLMSPPARDILWVVNGAPTTTIRNQFGLPTSPWTFDYAGAPINGQGGGGNVWGIVPQGTGWSNSGNSTYMLWLDDFWFDGTEFYQNYELVSSVPAQANYYW